MKALLTLTIVISAFFGFSSAAMAGGDTAYACHITSYNFDTDVWEGHVIGVSEKAVDAHCSHRDIPDHFPIGVDRRARAICDGEEGKAYDKCLRVNMVGQPCGRRAASERPVNMLCG